MLFWRKLRSVKLFRTLRFQLASVFILLLAIVLGLVGVLGTTTLHTILENQSEETLHEQLGALRGWIKFEGGEPYWFVDRTLPEEEAEVSRLEGIYVIANENGGVALGSAEDPSVLKELSDPKTIRAELQQIEATKQPVIKTLQRGRAYYQIISSTMTDPDTGRKWYVAEGRSLAGDQQVLRRFRLNLLIFLPIVLVTCALLGWYSARRGLRALQSVEKAAQEITGSNLGLQLAKRGAGDELYRLIDSFNEMSRRLKSSFEQVRQVSTDVSHELRTPLTAIQGQLEVALFTATRKEQLQE
ncbi:MAG: HAMP domain-containing protein, partial [Acidobacteriaceae bacterium]|nr:HAMP domain-containing protein [Acidobacteriaceae bacterium]